MNYTVNLRLGTLDRSIHCEVYSDKAADILTRLRNYLIKNWGSWQMERNGWLADIVRQPNGELTWDIYKTAEGRFRDRYYTLEVHSGNSAYAKFKTDARVRDWICFNLKMICMREFENNGKDVIGCRFSINDEQRKELKKYISSKWNRKNKDILKAFSGDYCSPEDDDQIKSNTLGDITVAEVYCLYDKLLNRKHLTKLWTKKDLAAVIGEEKDPAATQMEVIRREELAKLEAKHAEDVKKFDNDIRVEERQLYKELDEKYAKLKEKYSKLKELELVAYIKAKEDLEKSFNFMTAL